MLQKQVLETNEEIQEKRRHVREIETKLNQVIKESTAKNELIQAVPIQVAVSGEGELLRRPSVGQQRSLEVSKNAFQGRRITQMLLRRGTICI